MRAGISFLCFFIFAIVMVLLIPSAPVMAADTFFPDFDQLNGEIPGFPMEPGGVYVNRGTDYNDDSIDDYLYIVSEYNEGINETQRSFELYIGYFPVPTYLVPEGLTATIERETKYTSSGTGIQSLERLREYDNFRELELEDTSTDRFSILYYNGHYSTYGAWWGKRIFIYKDKYIIRMEGIGPGWESDTVFAHAFDLAEQYAKDSIDSLAGGLTLKHYNPLEYLTLTTDSGFDPRPAGNLVATITGENGKPIKGEYVLFYLPAGSPLNSTMVVSGDVPPFNASEVLGEDVLVLGHAITDKNGVATFNYLVPSILIDPEQFSAVLLHQRFLNDNNNVTGSFRAASIDMGKHTVIHQASVSTEFNGIAKIVRITGDGRSDEFKAAYLKEYPDSPTWGPGKVRVKRSIALPGFDYKPVEPGFILMPGDIIDIDGNVDVEIVWVTGDRVIARIPDKIPFGDTEVRPPHSRMVLSTTAYDSGFQTTWDKIQGGIFGFSIGQGLDVLAGVHPVATGVKKGAEFTVNVYDAIKEADFTNQNLMTKIRLRSVVRIDTTGEYTVVQTYEGSPDVLTHSGETVTLGLGETVTVDAAGSLGEVETFNSKNDTPGWSDTAMAWVDSAVESGEASDDADSGGISAGIIVAIIVVAVVIVGGGVFVLIRKKK